MLTAAAVDKYKSGRARYKSGPLGIENTPRTGCTTEQQCLKRLAFMITQWKNPNNNNIENPNSSVQKSKNTMLTLLYRFYTGHTSMMFLRMVDEVETHTDARTHLHCHRQFV